MLDASPSGRQSPAPALSGIDRVYWNLKVRGAWRAAAAANLPSKRPVAATPVPPHELFRRSLLRRKPYNGASVSGCFSRSIHLDCFLRHLPDRFALPGPGEHVLPDSLGRVLGWRSATGRHVDLQKRKICVFESLVDGHQILWGSYLPTRTLSRSIPPVCRAPAALLLSPTHTATRLTVLREAD
jgi:hypothetical protein